MARKDWLGICLDRNYEKVFSALGIGYEVLNLKGDEKEIALQIGKYAGNSRKKPFIVDFAHYVMAYCIPDDTTAIYFDNHADDGIDYEPQQKFTSGTFQAFTPRKQHIVLGATAKQYGRLAKVFPPEKVEDVFTEPLKERLFLSFDLDVLHPKFYDVGLWTQGVLSPEDISSIVEKLVAGREIVGLNIASYKNEALPIVRKIISPLSDFK
jgi:hypothetical protein